jgi:hypothetical protein
LPPKSILILGSPEYGFDRSSIFMPLWSDLVRAAIAEGYRRLNGRIAGIIPNQASFRVVSKNSFGIA